MKLDKNNIPVALEIHIMSKKVLLNGPPTKDMNDLNQNPGALKGAAHF